MAQTVEGDLTVAGTLRVQNGFTPPNSSIGDAALSSSNPAGINKVRHLFKPTYSQPYATSAFTERKVLHIARGAGNLKTARALVSQVATGNSTVDIDILKNGATMLQGAPPIRLDVGNAAFVTELATISGDGAYSANDVIEVSITATVGTGTLPKGIAVDIDLDELS